MNLTVNRTKGLDGRCVRYVRVERSSIVTGPRYIQLVMRKTKQPSRQNNALSLCMTEFPQATHADQVLPVPLRAFMIFSHFSVVDKLMSSVRG